MSGYTRARPLAVGVLAATLLIAGCTSSKPSGRSSSGRSSSDTSSSRTSSVSRAPGSAFSLPTSPPAASGDPAAVKLYAQAWSGLAHARSVRLTGTVDYARQPVDVDLTLVNGKGAAGSFGVAGGTVAVVAAGNAVYLKPDAKAVAGIAAALGVHIPASMLSRIAGQWLEAGGVTAGTPTGGADAASSSGPLAELGDLSRLTTVPENFSLPGSLSLRPGTTTINGQKATAFVDAGGANPGDSALVYVQSGGKHLPLEIKLASKAGPGGGVAGTLDFVDYNKLVSLTVPTSPISIAQLLEFAGVFGEGTRGAVSSATAGAG